MVAGVQGFPFFKEHAPKGGILVIGALSALVVTKQPLIFIWVLDVGVKGAGAAPLSHIIMASFTTYSKSCGIVCFLECYKISVSDDSILILLPPVIFSLSPSKFRLVSPLMLASVLALRLALAVSLVIVISLVAFIPIPSSAT